ncbi:MAG TPA: histidine kinase dimerization/phosphoacceptor domain -containing protein [Rhizomicrobium sp.]|nr:histidine kinase dimerization/phosphoacceptor domain -containing protein [Rhizomicrobium sp.]
MAALEHDKPADADRVAESNHRIANHLSLLAGLVQMQSAHVARGPETLTRTHVRGLLQETTGKIASIGNFHRRLAHRTDSENVDLGMHVIEFAKELSALLALEGRLSISARLETGCIVTAEQAQTAMLIVDEIVMNALKHAHPTGLPTFFSLSCWANADGSVSLEAADDGVGLPEGFDWKKDGGLGLKLIHSLSEKLDAGLEVHSDSLGLTFRLRIPPA